MRQIEKRTVQPKLPGVIRADKACRVARRRGANLRATMRASIDHRVYLPLLIPSDDHFVPADPGQQEISGARELALMGKEYPAPPENTRHFEVEYIGIGIDAPMHSARFNELGDFFG